MTMQQGIDRLNLRLMEDKDNFFGYFLFQMGKEIRFSIADAKIHTTRNGYALDSFVLLDPGQEVHYRDLINLLAYKVEAKPGLSYDDVVASMKARANKINFKFVGVNAIWKDVAATTGKPTPRVEIFNFCDANIARELLDYSLEFVIFLPCRIAVVEDAHQKIWLVMLDWDVRWVDDLPNPDRIPDSLRQGAIQLRQGLADIIQAGANGDL